MKHTAEPIAAALAVWFAIALGLGFTGRVAEWRPPVPQLVIALLTLSALGAALFVPRFRAWADHAPVRGLVGVHLSRFVGVYFLLLAHNGSLAAGFAIPAGWGDFAVALGALALLLYFNPRIAAERRYFSAWNIFGMLDILFVVVTAALIGAANPTTMQPLLRLPLCLLPTFLVPVIIVSHVLLFRRLRTLHLLPA